MWVFFSFTALENLRILDFFRSNEWFVYKILRCCCSPDLFDCSQSSNENVYSPIAFDERVTFGFNTSSPALCVCVCCTIFAWDLCITLHNHTHIQCIKRTCTRRVEAKKLLSCWRQSDNSYSLKLSYDGLVNKELIISQTIGLLDLHIIFAYMWMGFKGCMRHMSIPESSMQVYIQQEQEQQQYTAISPVWKRL